MAGEQPRAFLRFEGFCLDLGRARLLAPDGTEVALRPKPFDVLHYLAENAGRLVGRDELIGAVWSGIVVTDESVTQCVGEIRRALGAGAQHVLRTVPKRGYLLEAEVSREAPPAAGDTAAAGVPHARGDAAAHWPSLPDRPSLAVLPFANLSSDPEQEYLADGIVEDVITALSRIRWLFVIARNSSFAYRGRAVDVRQVGRELGVRYVLEGSIRRSGSRVRIAGQLVEAETGAHVWAERFEGEFADLFALQDDLAMSVAGAIQPAIASAEQERAARKAPENLGALDNYHRGLWHFHRSTATESERAGDLFRRAIRLAPGFAAAHAGLAVVCLWDAWIFRPSARPELVRLGVEHVRRAVALDPLDGTAHRALAVGLLMQGQHVEARAEANAALRLGPSDAETHGTVGAVLAFGGRPTEAVAPLERAMRLSPFDPMTWAWLHLLATAHYLARDYDAAIAAARELRRRRPDLRLGLRILIAALGQSGRLGEASIAASEAFAHLGPSELAASLARRPAELGEKDHAHLLEGWHRAGIRF